MKQSSLNSPKMETSINKLKTSGKSVETNSNIFGKAQSIGMAGLGKATLGNNSSIPRNQRMLSEQQNLQVLNVVRKYMGESRKQKTQEAMEKQNISQFHYNTLSNADKSFLVPPLVLQPKAHHLNSINNHSSNANLFGSGVELQRIEVDARSSSLCLFLDHEIKKMNEQIGKLQANMTKLLQEDYHASAKKSHLQLATPINSLVLLFNFAVGKVAYREQQMLLGVQQLETINTQFRQEYHCLQNQYHVLASKAQKSKNNVEQLRSEISRLRAVMQSYQMQTLELKKEVHILNEVIEEMNIQVEKAERRLNDKRKQYSVLEQDFHRVTTLAKQLQVQLKANMDIISKHDGMEELVNVLEQEVGKWKNRCSQLQQQMAAQNNNNGNTNCKQ